MCGRPGARGIRSKITSRSMRNISKIGGSTPRSPTLAAPIAPRTVEVEGDLDAMKASNITRITVQVHYPKFGTEMEENFSISPAKNEPLISKKIFMDRDA